MSKPSAPATSFSHRHNLPDLRSGIGLRREFYEEVLTSPRSPGWLEITPENFMRFGGRPQRILDQARERWTVIPHGVNLNIGGPGDLDEDYLTALKTLLDRIQAPFFTDHLCLSAVDGVYFQDLIPLPFTEEAVAHASRKARAVSDRMGRPFGLENPSFYAHVGDTPDMDEAAFLVAVAEAADCGILLDVNNVYVNSQNHGYDPHAFLEAIPPERVMQFHVAGHTRRGEVIIDTHIGPIIDPVWDLYEHAVRRFGWRPTLVEWDQEIPSLAAVLDEKERSEARARKAAGP
jgi:uncharacterized protein (UPF0276 family)